MGSAGLIPSYFALLLILIICVMYNEEKGDGERGVSSFLCYLCLIWFGLVWFDIYLVLSALVLSWCIYRCRGVDGNR